MGVKEFTIELNPCQQVYYPGQDVRGEVVMTVDDTVEAKDLKIRFMVKAQCRFVGKKSDHGSQTQLFSNDKMIVEDEQCLLSPDSDSDKISIPTGNHKYRFNFAIPDHVPSSFEGALGSIRYELKAQIGDDMVIRAFTVNDIIDTNEPEYDLCPTAESYEDVGCLCISRGTLHIKVNLDRSCYCPGEAMLVTIQFGDVPTRNMKAVKAKLVQTIKYRTKNRTHRVDKVVAMLKGPRIRKSNNDVIIWNEQPFGIPAVAPSINNSDVIEVEYTLMVGVGMKCGKDVRIKVPIKVGTVPYLETYGKSIANYGTPQDVQDPPTSIIIDGPIPDISIFGYQNMIPPCYSAPVDQGEVNISYEADMFVHGETSYYPIYTFAIPRELNGEMSVDAPLEF